jgi:LacI family transcriptional regulator
VAGRSSSKRPLQKDVAELAGVSRTTVSFVLNEVENIAIPDSTRQRVLDAAAQLGFRPNALARGLRGGLSNVLGLVTSDIVTTPYAVEIVKGAQDAAFARGITLLIVDIGGPQTVADETVERLHEWSPDGLIFATEYHRPYRLPPAAAHSPTVLVNCFLDPVLDLPPVPTIVPDEVQGGRAATQALLDAGHTRVAFVNGPAEYYPASTGRLAGYQQALAEANVAFDPDLVRVGDWWQESAARHTADLLALAEPPTALFCGNDWMAMGAYDTIREAALRIPDDIAVIGFDNRVEIADHMRPRLTTVALPYSRMGARAVEILLDPQLLAAARTELIQCPLIRRSSV